MEKEFSRKSKWRNKLKIDNVSLYQICIFNWICIDEWNRTISYWKEGYFVCRELIRYINFSCVVFDRAFKKCNAPCYIVIFAHTFRHPCALMRRCMRACNKQRVGFRCWRCFINQLAAKTREAGQERPQNSIRVAT